MMESIKQLTAGEITKMAIEHFSSLGFICWRSNQIPQRGRPFRGKLGVSDIIGYSLPIHSKSTAFMNRGPQHGGEFLAVEVKTLGDKLSEDQKKFLIDLNKAGGFGYLAEDDRKGGIRYYLYINEQSS